ncbi:MAG: hypothetical protein J0L64_04805 [Acidobacteria bacterium]|nr:hypothetical protein [Acidobacteriota bacterium]
MKRMGAAGLSCLLVAGAAWYMASNQERIDADERVSAMLPPPELRAAWEPEQPVQAISFGCQAALGVALLWFGARGIRSRRG